MPYSLFGKKLGWERLLQPNESAAATERPMQAATDMGMAHSCFSTMSDAFWKRYMTFTTMWHMARDPHHYWRPG